MINNVINIIIKIENKIYNLEFSFFILFLYIKSYIIFILAPALINSFTISLLLLKVAKYIGVLL